MAGNNDLGKPESKNGPVRNTGQWVRSQSHWYEDGSICIRIEDKLYNLHRSLLLKCSEAMAAVFTIPNGKASEDPNREGRELYPLWLEGITQAEFDDFLNGFLYRVEYQPIPEADKERVFTNLLKLSDKWIVDAGRAYAIKNLEDIILPPSRRLELAGQFNISDWVHPAVKSILDHKLTDLTRQDRECLGIEVFAIIVRAKEYMDVALKSTANVAPTMTADPSWECTDHKSCVKVWKRLWRDEIGWKLLHPKFPMRLDEILWAAQKFDHPGLAKKCLDDVCRDIQNNVSFFDERIVPAAADAIMQYHRMPVPN
ncbi:hypothetical protein B0H16DRAFT_1881722 [Mycena metata]|uniref:BTB domain-containing protein n=1 Tax=Mycena metata TaxID=1033252 RepID=A0AAD7JR78_9AGAR|nr:hypothetical protein B0H16DRAFT_1881716 [Mycena metata]KAJ7769862.1 hypothetical protein B0H16DRAFT_1881722 [Mycena metata]